MGLYLVSVNNFDCRKVASIFLLEKSHCFLYGNKDKVFDIKNIENPCIDINAYAEENKIDTYEIVLSPDLDTGKTLSYLSNYLTSKDVSIGLLTQDKDFIHKYQDELDYYGITISEEMFHYMTLGAPLLDKGAKIYQAPAIRKNKETIILEESFHDRFIKLLIESGRDNSEIYKAAGISRQVFSKIISDKNMTPTKLTLIALCIGLELPYIEAKQLIESAGYTLSRSIMLDSIVIKYLKNEIYDLYIINSELNEHGCPLLGWHPRED